LEIGVGLTVLHIGPEAADAGHDRLAALGMLSDLPREREQAERAVEIDVVGAEPLGQPGTFGLFAVDRLAELHVGTEAARAQRHFEAGDRILAELFQPPVGGAARAVARGELARVATVGIVGAADEAAEFAELEREPAAAALRTLARIAAVGPRRKQMGTEHLVERVDHLRDTQLLDVADGSGEIAPEVAQEVAPGNLVVGDAVELLLQPRG